MSFSCLLRRMSLSMNFLFLFMKSLELLMSNPANKTYKSSALFLPLTASLSNVLSIVSMEELSFSIALYIWSIVSESANVPIVLLKILRPNVPKLLDIEPVMIFAFDVTTAIFLFYLFFLFILYIIYYIIILWYSTSRILDIFFFLFINFFFFFFRV